MGAVIIFKLEAWYPEKEAAVDACRETWDTATGYE
jgi:hypothetical protein